MVTRNHPTESYPIANIIFCLSVIIGLVMGLVYLGDVGGKIIGYKMREFEGEDR